MPPLWHAEPCYEVDQQARAMGKDEEDGDDAQYSRVDTEVFAEPAAYAPDHFVGFRFVEPLILVLHFSAPYPFINHYPNVYKTSIRENPETAIERGLKTD